MKEGFFEMIDLPCYIPSLKGKFFKADNYFFLFFMFYIEYFFLFFIFPAISLSDRMVWAKYGYMPLDEIFTYR